MLSKKKLELFNTEHPESWRWKKIIYMYGKSLAKNQVYAIFHMWHVLGKMFCPNSKSLYRVFDKVLSMWQKLWRRQRTGKNVPCDLHALNWKLEFPQRVCPGACPLEKFWNLGLFRLFTVLYLSLRSSRSSALRFGLHLAWVLLRGQAAVIPDVRPLGTFENQDSRH